MFLGDLQNQAKIDFLKKQLFLAILRISAILELDFNEFSLYFRSQLGIFFDFLSGSYFEVNFWCFFREKHTTQKMKKCLSINKIQCFVRFARLQKVREVMKNQHAKNIDFSSKNRWKIDEKVGCSGLPSKSRPKHYHGSLTFQKKRFSSQFWGPGGYPRIVSELAETRLEPTWDSSGCPGELHGVSGTLLVPSRDSPGTLRGPPQGWFYTNFKTHVNVSRYWNL